MAELVERLAEAAQTMTTPARARLLMEEARREIENLSGRLHKLGNDANRMNLQAMMFEMLADAAHTYIETLESGAADAKARRDYYELKSKATG